MKTLIVFLAMLMSSAQAQDMTSVYYKGPLPFYNEAGVQVTAIAAGDTLASIMMPVYANNTIEWSAFGNAGDTVHYNAYYQFLFGPQQTSSLFQLPSAATKSASTFPARNLGYYRVGISNLSSLIDSLAMNGLDAGVTKTKVSVSIPKRFLSTTTHAVYRSENGNEAVGDSSVTYNYSDVRAGAIGVRIVLIGYPGQGLVGGEPTILNNNVVRVEPKKE